MGTASPLSIVPVYESGNDRALIGLANKGLIFTSQDFLQVMMHRIMPKARVPFDLSHTTDRRRKGGGSETKATCIVISLHWKELLLDLTVLGFMTLLQYDGFWIVLYDSISSKYFYILNHGKLGWILDSTKAKYKMQE